MPSSIGGLASGLDTAGIIKALLAAERTGRNRLETRQVSLQRQMSVWQDLNTKLATLRTSADAFGRPDRVATKASSSHENLVAVTAGPAAQPSTFSFRVQQLAAAHQTMAAGFGAVSDLVGAGKGLVASGLGAVGVGSVDDYSGLAAGRYELEVRDVTGGQATVSFAGKEQTVASTGVVTLTDNAGNSVTLDATALTVGRATIGIVETDATTTLGRLAGSITDLGAGVSASALHTGDGSATPTRFVLSAAQAGTAGALTVDLSGLVGFALKDFTDLRAAADARLVLADGVTTITRTSNRITDLMPGLTLDLRDADPATEITVTVQRDNDRMVQQVKSVVDNLNAVIGTVRRATATDSAAAATVKPALGSDPRARRLLDALRAAMQHTDDGQNLKVLGQVGITIRQDGTFALDETKLRDALTADHAGTVRLLSGDGDALKGAFAKVADVAAELRGVNGLLRGAMNTTQRGIDDVGRSLVAFDNRLSLVETRLRRQYTRLETTLAQLSSQASGLSRAIG